MIIYLCIPLFILLEILRKTGLLHRIHLFSIKIDPISVWKNDEAIQDSEFFIHYDEDSDRTLKKPIAQLSPKGLAALSYLYSLKDGSEKQPLISSTFDDLAHLLKLVDSAPAGTKVTTIFQGTDKIIKFTPELLHFKSEAFQKAAFTFFYDNAAHKTVFQIEKTRSKLKIINIDSTDCNQFADWVFYFLPQFTSNPVSLYYQKSIRDPQRANARPNAILSRQKNSYECGTFACRDARLLNQDPNFVKSIEKECVKENGRIRTFEYLTPPQYLKSIQSRMHSQYVLPAYGKFVVSKDGRTLRDIHKQHLEYGYTQHFSEKHRDAVRGFLKNHTPHEVREAVKKYDAKEMTAERLLSIYGP